MTDTTNSLDMNRLRGSSAYKLANDFEIAQRIGSNKTLDLYSEPQTETDQTLIRSRELLEKLRRMVSQP